jgi:hypothetical protein
MGPLMENISKTLFMYPADGCREIIKVGRAHNGIRGKKRTQEESGDG